MCFRFRCRWVPVFGKTTISLSERRPLVSGYYKLLGVVMDICQMFHYFEGCNASSPEVPLSGASNGRKHAAQCCASCFLQYVVLYVF